MVATDYLRDVGTGSAKRVPKLEGLRGILALGVLVYHVAFMSGVASFIDQPGYGFWGVLADGLGVMLPPFFVLSGMFLYRPYARVTISGSPRPRTGTFLWRRALRIMPAYWLLILVGLLAINLDHIDGSSDVFRPLAMIHFFWADGQPMFGLAHTWTVPTEFSFYLALPLIAWVTHKYAGKADDPGRRARRMVVPLVVLSLAGFAWIVYTNLPSFQGPFEFWYWPFYFIPFFATGMVLAIISAYAEATKKTPGIYRAAAKHPNLFWLVALAAYFVYATNPIGIPGMGDWPALYMELLRCVMIIVVAVAVIVPLTVADTKSRFLDGLLGNAPVRYLGRISYGIYLWHVIFIEFWFRNGNIFGSPAVESVQFRGTTGFWGLLVFTLALSVVAASISYYVVERPALRLRARTSSAPSGAAAEQSPEPAPANRA